MNSRKSLVGRLAALLAPSTKTLRGLLQAANSFPCIAVDWEPGSERVVVLAPHMDDEVLGCGGTIALHRRAGAPVTVIFLTDGREGSSTLRGLQGDELREAQKRLIDVRKGEAAAALATLDVDDCAFLDAVDGTAFADAGDIASRLGALLERLRPQILYVPSYLEQHPDHRATSDVLLTAVAGSSSGITVHAYEVWTPQYPNCLVGIDSVVDVKRAALAQYRSQLSEADFEHGILGLNAYRAMMRPRSGFRYAEAFCALPFAEYATLYRQFRDGSSG